MQLICVVQEPNFNLTDIFFSLKDHGPALFLNCSTFKQQMATGDLEQRSSFQMGFLITDKKESKNGINNGRYDFQWFICFVHGPSCTRKW